MMGYLKYLFYSLTTWTHVEAESDQDDEDHVDYEDHLDDYFQSAAGAGWQRHRVRPNEAIGG